MAQIYRRSNILFRVGLFGLVLFLVGCTQDQPQQKPLSALYETVIANDYQQLQDQSAVFQSTVKQCENVGEIQDSWRALMGAWQQVQWVRFGPIAEHSRQWQIQFWPDSKNTIGRKMKLLLLQDNLDLTAVQRAGIIIQGLPALEYVLFDPKAASLASLEKRCTLIQLIASEMVAVSSALQSEWAAFVTLESDVPRDAEVIDSLIQQLTRMHDQKLVSPLALTPSEGGEEQQSHKTPNPYFLESWRSGESFQNIQNNVVGLNRMFIGGFKSYLIQKGHDGIAQAIEQELAHIASIVEDGSLFSFKTIQDKESRSVSQANTGFDQVKSLALAQSLQRLQALFEKDVVQALQIRLGFNASDGDA